MQPMKPKSFFRFTSLAQSRRNDARGVYPAARGQITRLILLTAPDRSFLAPGCTIQHEHKEMKQGERVGESPFGQLIYPITPSPPLAVRILSDALCLVSFYRP